ncbi:hypothetical protein GTQ40_09115 [Flavobacteriaceae bacterium R38]|nr:hypothetical protein [Flavobacteriaceae bacterium R38]
MNSKKNFTFAIIILLLLAIALFGSKIIPASKSLDDFFAEEVYEVSYRYFFKTNEKSVQVKSYLPKNNSRQRISLETIKTREHVKMEKLAEGNNLKAIWKSDTLNEYENVDYSFIFEGKEKKFVIPDVFKKYYIEDALYLKASENIQSDHSVIDSIANTIKRQSNNDRMLLKNTFDYVYNIPSAPIITLTDAITVTEQNRASCNGKSRLFVAIMRNLGYPARIKGGIILENTNKRTSHVWAEVNINDQWIPFDTLNNHFGFIPANYLELYEGDKFLITHTQGINFDYTYCIQEKNHIPFFVSTNSEFKKLATFSLWSLIEGGTISKKTLILLILLPIGGLIVAFLRNIVGIKTFGVFLPVLITYALFETGFVTGILIFLSLIILVGIISKPFDKLGLLYTPKLVISLSLMVIIMTIGSSIGAVNSIVWLTSLTIFPTIILTISAERFSTSIVEDGFYDATSRLMQTLIAVTVCYFALSNNWLANFVIIFPEVLLIVICLCMLLGKYMGLRWVEVYRFKSLLNNA